MHPIFNTIHCTSGIHCQSCRAREAGKAWRESFTRVHTKGEVPVDFDCPHGKPWVEDKPAPDGVWVNPHTKVVRYQPGKPVTPTVSAKTQRFITDAQRQLAQQRKAICGTCEHQKSMTDLTVSCGKCGCGGVPLYGEAKRCPEGKWGNSKPAVDLATFFDRVTCINLKRRPDRWESFSKQMTPDRWPFKKPERIEAYDWKNVPHPSWWGAGGGAWGCFRSHLRVIEDSLNTGVKSLLLLEDDALLEPDFAVRVKAFLEHVPDDWDGLYLGGQHLHNNRKPPVAVNEHVIRCFNVNRTHAWAIRGKFMRDVYLHLCDSLDWNKVGPKHHIDHRLGVLHEKGQHKVYAPRRWLVAQDAGQSNILGKVVAVRNWNGSIGRVVQTQNPPVAVLGLYKGGSSVVAGVLHRLGVSMGGQLTRIAEYETYEAGPLRKICRESIDEPSLQRKASNDQITHRLREWIAHRRQQGNAWVGGKHPLMCLMGDQIVAAWGEHTRFVAVDRPVEESAASLEKAKWWPGGAGNIQRRLHDERERFLSGRDHFRVDYHSLRNNARNEVLRLIKWLGLSPTESQIDDAVGFVKPVKKNTSILISGYQGLGDTIYKRPIISHAASLFEKVYVKTSYPQVIADLLARHSNIKCVPSGKLLHPNQRNENDPSVFDFWHRGVVSCDSEVALRYGPRLRRGMTISQVYDLHWSRRYEAFNFHSEPTQPWSDQAKVLLDGWAVDSRPIAIIRPPTIRASWPCASRNPLAPYLQACVDDLSGRYQIIEIADLHHGERLDGPPLRHSGIKLHKSFGHVGVLAEVLRSADLVLGTPSFVLPMSLMVRARMFCVYGGHVPPHALVDPRMDLSNHGFVAPTPFCFCMRNNHQCDKTIPMDKVRSAFTEFIKRTQRTD